MESFIIEGGHPLKGTITPQGAKNEALQVICASLLTSDEVRIKNIPDILDVNNLIRLLTDMGVEVRRIDRNEYSFRAKKINLKYLESDEFVRKCSSLRGSVLLIGPLLARFGKAVVAKPGDDWTPTSWVSRTLAPHSRITTDKALSKSTAKRSKAATCCSMKHR